MFSISSLRTLMGYCQYWGIVSSRLFRNCCQIRTRLIDSKARKLGTFCHILLGKQLADRSLRSVGRADRERERFHRSIQTL